MNVAIDLFGWHVRRCAHDLTLLGELFQRGLTAPAQAEVHEHRFAAGSDHDVGRFQVAMDDAAVVGLL